MVEGRLLSILLLLQARGRMTAPQLAREFEVSVRTILRDIDQLSLSGIPVYAERGRAGGFQLLDGYRTKLTGLSQPEAEAIFLAGLPGPAAELGLSSLLSTARLKLLAALPAHAQPGAERIASRFHLDPTGWFRDADPTPFLQIVARAVWDERCVMLRYGRVDGPARKTAPLGLVLKGGVWYLIAQGGKTIRTYRVANIRDAEPIDEAVVRPKGFDLAEHWDAASRDYEAGVYRVHAEVRLSPKGRALLRMLGPHVVAAADETAGRPDKAGWVRCVLPIESDGDGVREMLRLATEVEVIGPPDLRARMGAAVAALSVRYG
jgi:predicted DNA-binding transcriptional regulator YafY